MLHQHTQRIRNNNNTTISPRMIRQHHTPILPPNCVNMGYLVIGLLIGSMCTITSILSQQTSLRYVEEQTNGVRSVLTRHGRSLVRPLDKSKNTEVVTEKENDPNKQLQSNVNKEKEWKLIHVYIGPNNPTNHNMMLAQASTISKDYFQSTEWFSQLRQDEIIAHLFRYKRDGYFIDLAANDAVRISNTYALERHYDWTGLAIEPNAQYWSALAYRKCDVVAAVVGNATRAVPLRFRFPHRAAPQGGLIGDEFDNHDPVDGTHHQKHDEDQVRNTIPLVEIMERFHTPATIDYLSLDIEGSEWFVMQAFPFDRYRINTLTVERPDQRLVELLHRNGYVQWKKLKQWGETLWVHTSMEGILDKTALMIDSENYKYREGVAIHAQ